MKTKTKLIFSDKYGNKLFEKKIIRNGEKRIQYSAKNIKGRIVDEKGLEELMEKTGIYDEYHMEPASAKGERMHMHRIRTPIIDPRPIVNIWRK